MYTTPSGFSGRFVHENPARITTLLSNCRTQLGQACVPPIPEHVEAGCELVRNELQRPDGATYGSNGSVLKASILLGPLESVPALQRPH